MVSDSWIYRIYPPEPVHNVVSSTSCTHKYLTLFMWLSPRFFTLFKASVSLGLWDVSFSDVVQYLETSSGSSSSSYMILGQPADQV